MPASRAGPSAVLLPDKPPDTSFLDLLQVLYHAHTVFLTIPCIQVFQARTGKNRAGMITVFPGAFRAETQCTGPAAFGVGRQAAIALIFNSDITNTKTAVHTTWCNLRYHYSKMVHSNISVHTICRKSRQANCNIFSSFIGRSTVTHPLAWLRNNCLPASHLKNPFLMLDLKFS